MQERVMLMIEELAMSKAACVDCAAPATTRGLKGQPLCGRCGVAELVEDKIRHEVDSAHESDYWCDGEVAP